MNAISYSSRPIQCKISSKYIKDDGIETSVQIIALENSSKIIMTEEAQIALAVEAIQKRLRH